MKDKWDKIDITFRAIGLVIGTVLIILGILNKDLYMFLGSFLIYLYLIKD